jgi:hypothetical protein
MELLECLSALQETLHRPSRREIDCIEAKFGKCRGHLNFEVVQVMQNRVEPLSGKDLLEVKIIHDSGLYRSGVEIRSKTGETARFQKIRAL